ncbi:Hypothetical predicted protein [Cloeon dipterum]|uniref:Tudor domain-containing protein n=1 Tax=Cloeon dipterum TaxID=197152 RepID=A0A8S1D057_9INSE|nr:Hypothetical predicted protein [Cloeon dipterum]
MSAENSIASKIRVLRAERRGVLLYLLCAKVDQLKTIKGIMATLAPRLEAQEPPKSERELIDSSVAVRVERKWLRGTMCPNGIVDFFDLGFKDAVSLKDVRVALPEMLKLPKMTFWAVLKDFYAHCGKSTIEEDLQAVEFEQKSITKLNNLLMIELVRNGVGLSHSLETDALGVLVASADFADHCQLETHQEKIVSCLWQGRPVPNIDSNEVLTMGRVLPVGVRLTAKVASAPKGPHLFNVLLDCHQHVLNLINKVPENILQSCAVGEACMVQMDEEKGHLERAIIREIRDDHAVVLLLDVDFSLTQVSLSSLRHMPPYLKQIPRLLTPVTMFGAERFSDSCTKAFSNMVEGKLLEMIVLPGDGTTLQKCSLSMDNRNVLDTFTEQVISNTYQHEELAQGTSVMVRLTGVRYRRSGELSFFAQFASNKLLETLNEEVNSICKTLRAPKLDFLTGDAVFARSADTCGRWMRAVVVACHGSYSNVIFVDGGFEAEVHELVPAPRHLVLEPKAQAVECYFVDLEINKNVASALRSFIGEKCYVMKVMACLENHKYKVTLLDPADYPPSNITNLLEPYLSVHFHESMSSVHTARSGGSSHLHGYFTPPSKLAAVASTSTTPTPPIRIISPSLSQETSPFKSEASAGRNAVHQADFTNCRTPSLDSLQSPFSVSCRRKSESNSVTDIVVSKKNRLDVEAAQPLMNNPIVSPPDSQSLPMLPKPALNYLSMVINPSSKFFGTLSWMVSPSKFFLQPAVFADSLNNLMAEIEELDPDNSLPPLSVEVGKPCLAKYEDAWYRAKVVGNSIDGKVDVQYVDYGNTAKVSLLHEIRDISMQLLELQTQAIPCSLRGVAGKTNWSMKEADLLTDLISDCKITVEVVGVWNDTFSVVITKGKVNVNLALKATMENLAPLNHIPDSRAPDEGEATVSWFNSPTNFYLQAKKSLSNLENLQTQCQMCFKGCNLNEKKLKVGHFVLVQSMVETFSRAEVLAIRGEKARLLLVDFGQTLVANIDTLFPLPDQLMAVEKYAFRCSLFDVEPYPAAEWPKAGQCTVIDKLFQSNNLTYRAVGSEQQGVTSVVIKIGGEDIRDLMQLRHVALRAIEKNQEDMKSYYVSSYELLPLVYVSTEENLKNICWIKQQLQVENLREMRDIEPGQNCIIDLGDRGSWHRAKMQPDRRLSLIDFGVAFPVKGPVYEVPSSMKKIPPQVITTCFAVQPPGGSSSFSAAAINKLLSMTCVGTPKKVLCREIGWQAGILYLEPQPLRGRIEHLKIEMKDLVEFSATRVIVSHFETAHCVYLQEDLAQVAWMENQMTMPREQLPFVEVGQLCASEYDGLMYRCRVTSDTKIHFIDYGNVDASDKWWKLTPEEEAMPPLSRKCSLRGADDMTAEEEMAMADLLSANEEYEVVFVGRDEIVIFKSKEGLMEVAKRMAPQRQQVLAIEQETTQVTEQLTNLSVLDIEKVPEEMTRVEEQLTNLLDQDTEEVPADAVGDEADPENEVCENKDVSELANELDESESEPSFDQENGIENESEAIPIKSDKPAAEEMTQAASVPPELHNGVVNKPTEEPEEEVLEKNHQSVTEEDTTDDPPPGKPVVEYRSYFVSTYVSSKDFHLQPDPEAILQYSEELSQMPDYDTTKLFKGDVCAALSDTSHLWSRAHVVTLRPPTVYFFDTGRVEMVTKFKQLNEKQRDTLPMAIKCESHIGEPDGGLREGVWIKAKLEDGCAVIASEKSKAVVTHYESHCELYLRLADDDLTQMEAELGLGMLVSKVNDGELYAAQTAEGAWRRARVTCIAKEGCDVFFVDYGDYSTVLKLRHLGAKWRERPAAANLCFLKPVPPPEAREHVRELLQPGVQVEVSGLVPCSAASEVSVFLDGVDVAKAEPPRLRPEADAFVPQRLPMPIGHQAMATFVCSVPRDNALWNDTAIAVGQFLLYADKLGILSESGKAIVQGAFIHHRNGHAGGMDTPERNSPDSEGDKLPEETNATSRKSSFTGIAPSRFCI